MKHTALLLLIACHSQPGIKISVNTADIKTYSEANAAYIPKPTLDRATSAAIYFRTPTSSCSGTYVQTSSGPKIATSAHCFRSPNECANVKVYFPQRNQAPIIRTCSSGSLRLHPDSDLALFSLTKAPPSKIRPLSVWANKFDKPRAAFVIHYPLLTPRQTKQNNQRYVTGIDCYAEGSFNFYQQLANKLFFYGLAHTCDIATGSSGAGLIDLKTAQVLGVIWGDVLIYTDSGVQQRSGATHYRYVQQFLAGEQLPAATALNTLLGYIRD